jgi:hypothetical protein
MRDVNDREFDVVKHVIATLTESLDSIPKE